MKCLRFFFSLIRGPPTNKGVFTGFQPRKDALFLLGGVAERLLHPAVNRRSHGGGFPYPRFPRWRAGSNPAIPAIVLLSIHFPGLAELEDALGLGPSWGCPVGRSPSPCEFDSRAPDHLPCTTSRIFPSTLTLYLTQALRYV